MNKYIEIPAGKGCLLFLTPEEYARGLKRGKGIKRSQIQKKRERAKFFGEGGGHGRQDNQ